MGRELVKGDMDTVKIQFASGINLGVTVNQRGSAGPQRFDFGAGQDNACLHLLVDMVVVVRFFILADDLQMNLFYWSVVGFA